MSRVLQGVEKMNCPSEYPCPFKQFSMKGMECLRDSYPHLTVFCCLKEGKIFMSREDYAELIKKIENAKLRLT